MCIAAGLNQLIQRHNPTFNIPDVYLIRYSIRCRYEAGASFQR